jgi:hypothetical protein
MSEEAGTPKNNTRMRRRISFAIAVVVTLAIVVVIHRQSRLLPDRIARYVNSHYLAGSPFEFSLDGISGTLVHTIVLKNPVLRYNSPTATYNVFRADRVSVKYELMPVFAFRLIVHDLDLEGVALHLRQDAEGRLVLPVPQNESPSKPGRGIVNPVVDVRSFHINGLEMTFGGNRTELAVRDVHLSGSCGYSEGVGQLRIDDGGAYLIDSGKTVSAVRLGVRTDGSSLFLDDFAVRLDESFVMANGEFRHGRFQGVDLVFNPISLPELHQLGIAPDLEGTFAGRLSLAGTVDSLQVSGTASGAGLGVELSGVSFNGTVTPAGVEFRRFMGRVFGSYVDGAFRIALPEEDFVFDGKVDGLDLSRGFIEDSDLPPMSMTGRVRVEHDKSEGTYAWRGDLDRGVVDGFENFHVAGSGIWRDGVGLTIDNVAFDRPGYRVEGSGSVTDEGSVADIVFRVEATDLAYFWNHFELPPVEGAINATGRIQGPIEDFQLNVNGSAHGLHFEFLDVDSAEVQAEARNVGSLAPTVRVSIAGRHGAAWGRRFDNPAFLVDVDTSLVRVPNARVTRGDTTIVVDLDVHARGRSSRIDVRHAEILTPADNWRTVAPSVIFADDDGVMADTVVFESGRGRFGGAGSYSERTKTMDLSFWGRGVDLSVLRDGLRAPILLRGRGDFGLQLEGPEENPRVRLDVDVVHGVVDSVSFDELRGSVVFDGHNYRLSRMHMVAARDTIEASGTWQSDVSPVRLVRGERPESVWDAALSLQARLAHFPIATFFTAMHRAPPVATELDGRIAMSGTLVEPRITLKGRIRPSSGRGRPVPPATIDAEYADGELRVRDVHLDDVVDARVSGKFPLTISMRDGVRLDTDGPLEFRLVIPPGSSLKNVSRYVPEMAWLRGVLSGTVIGRGTPSIPAVTGDLNLSRGELRVAGMLESFSNVTARIDFMDDVVRLTTLSARAGDKGAVVGNGWARISNYAPVDYRADLSLRDFRLKSIPDVDVLAEGTLVARLHEWREGKKIPLITGSLDVREASIYMELTGTTGEGGGPVEPTAALTLPTDEPGWMCSVDLHGPKNVWVRNPDLNVEMAGDVILKKDERGMYFRGDLAVLRGSYRVYGYKFTITGGTMDFSAAETLRPAMFIEAYTPHHTGDGPDRNIYLTLSWPYDKKEPEISLAYDEPGYSEADIWNMLGGPTMFASGMATNTLERLINAQMTGFNVDVEQRSIEDTSQPGTTLEQETLIGVGRYLWEDIYFQYKRGLSVGSEQEVNVEYRLSNKFLIRSQYIYNSRRNRAGIAGQNTDEFNLDLKYRFEY